MGANLENKSPNLPRCTGQHLVAVLKMQRCMLRLQSVEYAPFAIASMTISVLTTPSLPAANQRRFWQGTHSLSGRALAIAEAAARAQQLFLVICANNADAEALHDALAFFVADNLPVLQMPDRETLAYDSFSPHQDIVSDRLKTLHQLRDTQHGILVCSVATLMHRLPPPDYIHSNSLQLTVGDKFNLNRFTEQLAKGGYRRTETVLEHGEFAVRGSLVDIYPMGSNVPYRIDLFDDEIESLRSFDPESQRSDEPIEQTALLPAGECALDQASIRLFKDHWHQQFPHAPRDCSIYTDVSNAIAPPGIEYYLPLFYEHTASLFDYLPTACTVFREAQWAQQADKFWRDATTRYTELGVDPRRPLLPPPQLFWQTDELHQMLSTLPKIDFNAQVSDKHVDRLGFAQLPDLSVNTKSHQPWHALETYLSNTSHRVLFSAESAGRREALAQQLQKLGVQAITATSWQQFIDTTSDVAITTSGLAHGFELPEAGIALVTEDQLFGNRVRQTRARRKEKDNADQIVRSLAELTIDTPVVHIDHGIGRYKGLQTLSIDEQDTEFLLLEYADDAKLYVPVSSLNLISRYTGADVDSAPLHRLGTDQWQKAKEKAAKQVKDTAAELLSLYAKRESQRGYAYPLDNAEFEQFCADFPFEETIDQQTAISAVVADMCAPKPMDRLVCGDVGFGKTEVAMRAAYVAVAAHKQVAVLVPTTLLAQQHFESFRDRFAELPVNVAVLSRFVSDKDQQAVLAQVEQGKVDILVGTHRLLSKQLPFRDLGLLIIDEEHRFGVRHKDKLKALRANVDILTLTATPIPRTLNMAMSGMRDLSIIATPPAKRLSVKTFVRQYDQAVVKEAILREILRGGQVFFLHNDVKTIEQTAREIEALVDEARVVVAHGQMRERDLETVMGDFYHKRFNVMVCSTIIETGIDIPSANTIIINRADKFGLAQLHQLRGRVGRSHHQAYAYLMTPHPKAMTADAEKRLDAISEATDLGAGFTLATHDLEIRGAGALLGEAQTGHISAVGYSLFMQMLNRAVNAIKRGEEIDFSAAENHGADINLNIPALIPDDYMPDINTRLTFYKRISDTDSADQLDELKVELIDRFGLLPPPLNNLFDSTLLRQQCDALGITKATANAKGGVIEFAANTKVEPLKLIQLVQANASAYSLKDANKLTFSAQLTTVESRFEAVFGIMAALH